MRPLTPAESEVLNITTNQAEMMIGVGIVLVIALVVGMVWIAKRCNCSKGNE